VKDDHEQTVISSYPLLLNTVGVLFKISETSPTKLYIWSGWNGWLFIDIGDRKDTTQESIDQFLDIMKAYTNEKEIS
jgi:hypothetical protein